MKTQTKTKRAQSVFLFRFAISQGNTLQPKLVFPGLVSACCLAGSLSSCQSVYPSDCLTVSLSDYCNACCLLANSCQKMRLDYGLRLVAVSDDNNFMLITQNLNFVPGLSNCQSTPRFAWFKFFFFDWLRHRQHFWVINKMQAKIKLAYCVMRRTEMSRSFIYFFFLQLQRGVCVIRPMANWKPRKSASLIRQFLYYGREHSKCLSQTAEKPQPAITAVANQKGIDFYELRTSPDGLCAWASPRWWAWLGDWPIVCPGDGAMASPVQIFAFNQNVLQQKTEEKTTKLNLA